MPSLDGKKLAQKIRQEIKKQIIKLNKKPGLAVILVGNDPASHLYVSLKEQACQEAGIFFEKYLFSKEASEEKIIKQITILNHRPDINGILVQLPLPQQEANKIIAAIDPNKDVDGFHQENLKRLENDKPCLLSPVVLGVKKILEQIPTSFQNQKAILIMSQIFARPFVTVLNRLGITSETVSYNDLQLKEKTKKSDLVITAVGKPGLINGSMIKPGSILIDIGTTRLQGKTVGDIDRQSIEPIAGWFTPVPGGVGPMTVAMLLWNVLAALRQQNQQPEELKNYTLQK